MIANSGYLTFIEGIRMILPFVALPYILRTIGAENYGKVVFAQTIVSYFVIFINFGMDVSAVKDVAVNRDNKNMLDKVVSSIYIIKIALLAISALIYVVLVMAFVDMRNNMQLYSFAFLTCISEVLSPVWFFLGIEKMKYLAMTKSLSLIFYTVCVFIFIRNPDDYVYVALFYSLGNILSGLAALYLLKKERVNFKRPSYNEVTVAFKESVPFFISRLSNVFNGAFCKTICGVALSKEALAAFDLVMKLCQGANIPAQILNQTTYPHNAKNRSKTFAKKMFRLSAVIGVMIMIVAVVAAPLLINIFAGSTLPEAIPLLRLSGVYMLISALTIYTGSPILVAWGYSRPFNNSVVHSTLVLWCVLGAAVAMNILSMNVLMLSLILAESYMLAYRLYYCYKYNIF
jgi:PST family polysaccharide transporter